MSRDFTFKIINVPAVYFLGANHEITILIDNIIRIITKCKEFVKSINRKLINNINERKIANDK